MHYLENISQVASMQSLMDEVYHVRKNPMAGTNKQVLNILHAHGQAKEDPEKYAGQPAADEVYTVKLMSTLLDTEIDATTLARWVRRYSEARQPLALFVGAKIPEQSLGHLWTSSDQMALMYYFKQDIDIVHALLPPMIDWDDLFDATERQFNRIWREQAVMSHLQEICLRKAKDDSWMNDALPRLSDDYLKPVMMSLAVCSFVICANWSKQ